MDINHFKSLRSVKDKARYLLTLDIEACTDIVDLEIVYRACIGDVTLPIISESESECIRKAREWLTEKSEITHDLPKAG